MPPSTPADPARQRQQVAEHPDEVGHHDDARAAARSPKAWKHAHSTRDVEGPPGDRAEQAPGRARARARSPCARRWPVEAGAVASRRAQRGRGGGGRASSARPGARSRPGTSEMARNSAITQGAEDRRHDRDRERRAAVEHAACRGRRRRRPARPCRRRRAATRKATIRHGDDRAAPCPSGAAPRRSARCRPRRRRRTAAWRPARPS